MTLLSFWNVLITDLEPFILPVLEWNDPISELNPECTRKIYLQIFSESVNPFQVFM